MSIDKTISALEINKGNLYTQKSNSIQIITTYSEGGRRG